MSSIHLEVLDKKRKEYFYRLERFKKKGTLAGGTALALQLAHRHSLDFDIFSPKELRKADYRTLRKYFKIKEVKLSTCEQLTCITDDDISITFVYYPYKNIFKIIKTPSLHLFSYRDIALDKAFTIGRRGTWRDYVDIFFLLKNNFISIPEILKGANKKFKEEFNEKLFLEQLVYYEDLGEFKISFFKDKYSEKEVKQYLINKVKEFKKREIL